MTPSEYTIETYTTETGKIPFQNWWVSLEKVTRARIEARLDQVALGNFGDHRHIEGEIYELRFTFGPGYRIYYAIDGEKLILLLVGGNKSSQKNRY